MSNPTIKRAMAAYNEICYQNAEMASILDINNIESESIDDQDAANFERVAELLKQSVIAMAQYRINAE